MFWADEIAGKLKGNQHIADGKTPSGRIHVGSLRGVLIHDVILRAIETTGNSAEFSYIFDDFDAFDGVPSGLDENEFKQYLGMPLRNVPSPDPSQKSYAEYFALEFARVMKHLGVNAKILWQTDLHKNGSLDETMRKALDNAEKIQEIYRRVSGSQQKEGGWFPFQAICQNCGKIGTTRTTGWDGKEVSYECVPNLVTWAIGCGHKGSVSPFGGTGKLPWKIYWPARWAALAINIEGEGKDLASKGGARDVANHIAQEIYQVTPPMDIAYEFFLFGGAKMSTSKGVGISAAEVTEIMPPELIRFLMLRYKPMQAINFDPFDAPTIPKLFDEYDKAAQAYVDKSDADLSRVFELAQINGVKMPPKVRFSVLAQWVQMPNMEDQIKQEGLEEWVKYARIWVEKFAPESEKFIIQETVPDAVKDLTTTQKEFLKKVAEVLDREWTPEEFQTRIYDIGKELELGGKDAFAAIYTSLLGKPHGPKAGWLILSLDKEFVKKRFTEVAKMKA